MTEPECGVVRRGQLEFSTLAMGDGPLVLCLHGFPDNAGSYRHQLPILAQAGYRAISMTLRGYEPSSLPDDADYALEALAGDVIACLDDLGVERAHLVGHDWGAAIAYTAGGEWPQRFLSLTTMAVPHAGRFLTEAPAHPKQLLLSWYMLFFQLRGIADYVVERRDFRFIERLWRSWSPGWDFPRDVIEDVIATLRQPGVKKAALGYYRASLSPGALPVTPGRRRAARYKVAVPTLAMTGEKDGCIDSGVFQDLMYPEDFPGGLEVRCIPGAGHFLHQEDPETVNALLLEWLAKNSPE